MIDASLIDWSRAQFALTACYHWVFVPLTLGLAVIMAVMETIYVVKKDEFWKKDRTILDETVRNQLCCRNSHRTYS